MRFFCKFNNENNDNKLTMVSRYVPNFTLGVSPGVNTPNGHPQSHIAPMPLGVAMAATAAAAAAAAAVPLSTITQTQTQPQQPQSGSSAVGQPSQQPPLSQVHTSQTMKGPPPQFPLSNSQTSAEYHVQQCLMSTGSAANASQQVPPQHQHYRFIHSRSDGYVAAPSTGFPAPQSGPSHQGPPVIRGMQSAPPSTPPQQDLSKMQQPPQTMYVPTGGGTTTSSVRPNQQANLFRNASTAAPRGSRQITMPQMFQPQMQQMVMPFYAQHAAPRQQASQMYTPSYFSQAPQIPTSFNYPYFVPHSFVSQHRPNTVPGGIVSAPAGAALAAGPGAPQAQILSTNVLAGTGTAAGQPGTGQTTVKRRRKHAIDIIDPNTNKNVLDDMEMSKIQNATVLDVDYQEQMNLPPQTNDILCGGVTSTNQILDSNINTDPNYSNKTSQGMPFVDMMHHKISAIPPSCQTQIVSQVNEIIGSTTPIVSAMSDGPSVEIHPKQQTKKKNRSVEPIPPLPTQTTTTDKVFAENSKTQGNVHGHTSINEGCPEKSSQQITTAVNVPLVNQTEDNNLSHNNKAINRNGENKTISIVHSNSANVTESSLNIDSKDSSSVINDGSNNKCITPIVGPSNNINSGNSNSSIVHQQQQQNNSVQYSLLSSVQQHHPTSTSFSNNQQQQQQQSKRDIKSSSIYHQQQKSVQQQHSQSTLPSPATNSFVVVNSDSSASNTNSNQSSSSNNKYFSPQTITASSTSLSTSTTVTNIQQQQQQQSVASIATVVSNKGISNSNNNSLPVVSNTPSKNNKGKDKAHHHQHHYHHQQQQQLTSNNNNNNNNPEKTDTTDTVVVGTNLTISQNKQSNNSNITANNISQQSYTAVDNKMKLNEKDENKQKLISPASTATTNDQQQQHKDLSTTNTTVSHSSYGKKMPLHDKNENKICDQFDNNNDIQKSATTTISTTTTTNLSLESNNNFDNRSSLENATTTAISRSLDETDRVCNIDASNKLVDNVIYNKNDKSINAVNENVSLNSSSTVFPKSKSSSTNNDNDNRTQQKQPSSVHTGNNNTNISSSSSNMKNTTQSSETETILLPSTSSDKREINDNEISRRQSNSSAIDSGSLATDSPTITNGSVTPLSCPLSPPSINNSATVSANTDHQEKLVQPVSTATQSPICYNDDQKSPVNQSGSRTYDRNQLLNLRNAPASKLKPDIKYEIAAIVLQGTRVPQSTLLPNFANRSANKRIAPISGPNMSLGSGGSMSGSTSGNTYLKQTSMSGVNAKNNSKGSKTGMIHLSLSLREDVKLNETENAWRPTHLKQNENLPPEERAKDELLRKVRGILNKLTPEKFDTLVDQIMKLQIDSKDKVNGVMMLVFEKAIDEPNFSTSYAKLCQCLADHKLPEDKSDTADNEKTIAQQRDSNLAAFKSTLLNKTEHEFKDNVSDCQAKQRKLQPLIKKIAECTDEEKKLELQAILEEEERKIRRRSGGTVRFIGELFKISMLTHNIIRNCIDDLLDPTSEDKLECLCKLLSTVGEKFESTPSKTCNNLNDVITKMKHIVNRKVESKISSRVRFMLQDVIDLRKKHWISTKTDANPKTMDQIQKEAKTEQMTSQYANFNLMSSNKDRRFVGGSGGGIGGTSGSGGSGLSFGSGSNVTGGSGSGGYYKSNRQAQSGDDTWYTQTPKGNRAVDTNKLMFSIDIDNGTKLGGMTKYQWTSGSSGIGPTTTTSNSFAVLSSLDSSKSSSSSGPRNKGSYNKESMERDRYGSSYGSRDNSSSRSASARGSIGDKEKDRDRENSSNRGSLQRGPPSHHSYSSSPSSTVPSRSNKAPSSQTYDAPRQPPPAVFEKPNDEISNSIKLAIFEMVDISEESFRAAEPVILKFPDKYYWNFIFAILNDYLHSTKVKPNHRKIASGLVYHILRENIITIEHFRYAYQEFSELADDIAIDVPELWQYIFQFIGPLVYKKVLTVKDIWNDTLREKNMGNKFLKEMILFFVKEVGFKYMRELWRSSNLKWSDFLLSDDIENYIQENSFKFIESEEFKAPVIGTTDMQKIRDRLKELLNETPDIDAINDYLDSNIVNIDKPFIRVLTEILCGYAIINNNGNKKLDSSKFRKVCIPLLNRYLDSKEERELECLYAIQLLIHKLEHPSGLLNEIFGELYDADIIPFDSFQKWRDSKDEPTGKGVAVKGLHSFFSNILMSGETSDENN